MIEVTLYIETSIHGPRKMDGTWGYVLEFIKADGTPETRCGFGKIESTTENVLALTAICAGMTRLIKPCSIRIKTCCDHVLNSVNNFWPVQWEKNNWVNNKGKEVKNADLWQQYVNLARIHCVSVSKDDNSYKSWIGREMEERYGD